MALLLTTAYLPPTAYIAAIACSEKFRIEVNETYHKQTLRNRCVIYGANGKLPLTVPVIKANGSHTKTKDIRISYQSNWQHIHWTSITSGYNSSPYFLYYKDHFEPFYSKKFNFLLDLNSGLLSTILNLLEIKRPFEFTGFYEAVTMNDSDMRNSFDSKVTENSNLKNGYYQVFRDKHGFIPGLSIIDLLFNEGKKAMNYIDNLNY